MFSIGERSGLQAGQFSTRTLLLQSHAVVIAALCGFAVSCWNTQGQTESSCGLSCPVCLAPEGFSCHVMYCPVCLAPEGSGYPLTSPGKFFLGVERVPAIGAGPRGPRPRPQGPPAMASWAPCTAIASWAPSSAMASWAPSSAMVSVVCSALEVPVLCSCPCLSRAPTPPPRWNFYGVGHAFREGELCQGSVVCVMCSRLLFPYLVCFLSLSDVIIS